jgi:2-polyprenyl-3-methyl-5-hydroxy-6-metoxy-1,4-benzoquinol methylase
MPFCHTAARLAKSNPPPPTTSRHPHNPKQQFQDRAFWDNFFKERGAEAFEWYGTFRELRPFLAKAIPERTGRESQVLVVGCGNSDFSTQLYLEGGYHRVVNVDFSAPVIAEMESKTASLCPEMRWEVQDVTALTLEEQAVDVVLDKGTLDAIFSTPESEPQVRAYAVTCVRL